MRERACAKLKRKITLDLVDGVRIFSLGLYTCNCNPRATENIVMCIYSVFLQGLQFSVTAMNTLFAPIAFKRQRDSLHSCQFPYATRNLV